MLSFLSLGVNLILKIDKKYIVYKHTVPNGKVYIGITSQSVNRRWKGDGSGYKKQSYFWNAIQKYGWDNIKHEILFCELSKEDAERKEIELISQYNSTDRNFGYNRATGGCVNSGFEGSQSMKGKHHKEETKRLLSEQKIGKYDGSNNPRAKKVLCVETGEIFDCIKDASSKYGTSIANISAVCKGKLKTTARKHWVYVNED